MVSHGLQSDFTMIPYYAIVNCEHTMVFYSCWTGLWYIIHVVVRLDHGIL